MSPSLSRRQLLATTLALATGTFQQAWAAASITFAELYAKVGVLGMSFSDKAKQLIGQQVTMRGYMAPPLRAEANFFVLTRIPVSVCPFCDSDADWPADIVVVYLNAAQTFSHSGAPIEVSGTWELGSRTDADTGFVSLLRITHAEYKKVGA